MSVPVVGACLCSAACPCHIWNVKVVGRAECLGAAWLIYNSGTVKTSRHPWHNQAKSWGCVFLLPIFLRCSLVTCSGTVTGRLGRFQSALEISAKPSRWFSVFKAVLQYPKQWLWRPRFREWGSVWLRWNRGRKREHWRKWIETKFKQKYVMQWCHKNMIQIQFTFYLSFIIYHLLIVFDPRLSTKIRLLRCYFGWVVLLTI